MNHILESIRLIEDYNNLIKEDFLNDDFIQDAVTQRINVISESVNYLSEDFKESYPSIPWKTISSVKETLENEEIHLEMIWDIVENGIPLLKKEILKINEVKASYLI